MKKYIVYVHANKINKKKYVGITSQSAHSRWRDGKGYGMGYKNETYFFNAIQKYGWDNFEHVIVKTELTEEEAREMEAKLIVEWNTNSRMFGYNLTSGGEGISDFHEFSETEIERRRHYMSKRVVSRETRQRVSAAKKGRSPWNKGKVIDEKYRQRISETHGQSKRVRCNSELFENITECANYIGVQRKTLSEWLSGKRKPSKKYAHFNIEMAD